MVCRAVSENDPPGFIVVLSTPEPLTKLEKALGIAEKKVRVPSIMGRFTIDLPLLYLILIGILVYMGGPRAVLPLVALAYFLTTSTSNRD